MEILQISSFFRNNQNDNNLLQNLNSLNTEILS